MYGLEYLEMDEITSRMYVERGGKWPRTEH